MRQILHFGLGNFARAHLLDYTQDAKGWNVIGVSLRSPGVRDGLAKQNFDYDLCVQERNPKRITVLNDVLVAPESPKAVLDAMTSPPIISATVTEKGYHLDSAGNLDVHDPLIASDLSGNGPQTLIGFLAHGLAKRTAPVTVLSCDNRVENGLTLQRAVQQFAKAAGLGIDWSLCSFPNAMVDRITPATTDAIRAITSDQMAVATEPFREWVIEDTFAGPRPDWPDVQFVSDVAPHELRKLRMLNGAHSLLAYAGIARGHTYVHEAISDPKLRAQTQALMRAAASTLPPDSNAASGNYADALIKRFENPALKHALRQIAMDGSQKVAYRFIETIRDCLRNNGDAKSIVVGLHAWIRFCMAETKAGRALDDPMAADIARAAQSRKPVAALLELIDTQDLEHLITV